MKRNFKVLSLGVLALLTLAACGGSKEKAADAPKKDKIVIAQGADAKTLDPHGTNDQPSSRIAAQIYDRLVEQDAEMKPQPGLAEKWEQPDPLTTIFHLRKGVKFHNGEELKASDVKFTLERMVKSAQVGHIAGPIDKVEIVDDYTVKVITKTPFGPLLNHLAHTAASIMNEKAVTEAGDAYGQKPVGTGPYALQEWKVGDSVTLTANKDYFKGASPVGTAMFRSIPEDSNRTIALETKEADIAYDISQLDAKKIKDEGKINLVEEPSLSMSYVGFNTAKKPFDDKKVRQAVAYAINTKDIISTVYHGAAQPANSPIGPKVFGYSKNAHAYELNVEKAKELLKEAGLEGGFTFKMWTNDSPARRDIAQIIQAQLKENLNVDMAIETLEWGSYLDRTAKGEHDMFILGWVSVTGDADYGLYALFHSTQKGGAGNRSFYENKEVDALLDKARSSTSNEERVALYDQAQIMIQEDLPIITIAYTNQNAGVQKDVKNFVLNPAGHHKIAGISFE